jgi:hypothetical protein
VNLLQKAKDVDKFVYVPEEKQAVKTQKGNKEDKKGKKQDKKVRTNPHASD